MEELKVLLLCCSRFALPVMQQLVYFNQLKAVIIPAHSKELADEVSNSLATTGIPVILVEKESFSDRALEIIKEYEINMGLVATFNYIIPAPVFSIPEKGFYNLHPGPLPAYRGADPIFHQIKNREKYAGVTIHKLDEGLDTGEIVLQENIRLDADDTYGILAGKLAAIAARLTGTLTKILAMGFEAPSKPQDESKAYYYEKQELHEIAIDWQSMDADTVIALINACNPHNKGAATRINQKLIHLLSAERGYDIGTDHYPVPGTILSIDDQILEVAVLNGESLQITFIYMDEGFVTPACLIKQGLRKGTCFENIFAKN